MTNLEQQIVSLLGLKEQNEQIEDVLQTIRYYLKHQNLSHWEDMSEYERGTECTCENIMDVIEEKHLVSKIPNISYLNVVRAKYEVEKRRFAKDIVFKAEHGSLTKISFSRTWKDFITDLWRDWQGESLSEQTDMLKKWIEKELG